MALKSDKMTLQGTVQPWACSICGEVFEPDLKAICSRCGRLCCPRHRRDEEGKLGAVCSACSPDPRTDSPS